MAALLLFALPQLLPAILFFFALPREKRPAGSGAWLVIGLYLIYNLLVPAADYFTQTHSFFGFSYALSDILKPEMALVYGLGLSAFLGAYFVFGKFKPQPKPGPGAGEHLVWFPRILVGIQVLVWALIFLNYHLSGIEFSQLLNPGNREESTILFSANWAIPGLEMLANCLPVCLYLQWRFEKKWTGVWVFLFIIWLFFSLLSGWRYRIILFFMLMVLHLIQTRQWKLKPLLPACAAGALIFSWLTLNRMAIAKRQFDLITFDLRQFDLDIFTGEFSNSRTFRSTLLYLNQHPEQKSDGLSWFRYAGNKFKPKSSFPGGLRPKPWILEVTKAWIPPGWPWNPNPAVTQMEEFFLTFGFAGLMAGMMLIGCWTAWLDIPEKDAVLQAFKITGIALLFQWTTRGFFLHQVQISLVCFFPLAVLYILKPYLPHGSAANKA